LPNLLDREGGDETILQRISTEEKQIPFFWQGGASTGNEIVVSAGGKIVGVARQRGNFLDVVISVRRSLASNTRAEIQIKGPAGDSLKLPLLFIDPKEVPVPPGTNDVDRNNPGFETAQGLWLLSTGGPHWRVEALALLKRSATKNNDYIAARVYRAVISDEWSPSH